MRISLFAVAAIGLLAGCSKSPSSAVAPPPALAFKPLVAVNWPAKPTENSEIISTPKGDEKHYKATTSIDRQPDGVIVLAVFVMEYPEAAMDGTSREKLLESYVFAFKKDETSRKPVLVGPPRHAGLDIDYRRGDQYGRKIVVVAGRRIYEVSVQAKKEEYLALPEVRSFMESFTITE